MSNDNDDPELEEFDDADDEIIEEDIEEEPSATIFEMGKAYVSKEDVDRISQQGFYGTRLDDGRLELEPVEVLHLLERKRVTVQKPTGEEITAKYIVSELIQNDTSLWVKYLVFRDLRSRGYAVRQGFGGGLGFRVYGRGDRPGTSTAKQLVYVMREGVPITLHDLDMVTETSQNARKNLVFALVDQNGEVNYYKVAKTELKDIGGTTDE